MALVKLAVLITAALGAMAASDTMGPAAFMWPPDRVWNAQIDNTSPCGSVASPGNRTNFPLEDGLVSLTAQDDSYSVIMSISFKNGIPSSPLILPPSPPNLTNQYHLPLSDPKTQSDFTYTINPVPVPELDPGHTCLRIPSPPETIAPGTNATIQLRYTADFDRPENQTFYACADITYVRAAEFNAADVPCFNATSDQDVPAPTATGSPTNLPGHGDNGPPLTSATGTPASQQADGGTLSRGAIAGAVVGSVVGLGVILGLGLMFYRERQKKRRLERQRDSARGVGWRADAPGKDSASAGSFAMGDMAR
jgi:hypothetical protein